MNRAEMRGAALQRVRGAVGGARNLVRDAATTVGVRAEADGDRLKDVRVAAFRVAVATTVIVAALYVVIALSVSLIVGHNLTANIDSNLLNDISYLQSEVPGGGSFTFNDNRPLQIPTVLWVMYPDGDVRASVLGSGLSANSSVALPVDYRHITDPTTLTLSGSETDVRVAGTAIGAYYVVVGQSMTGVYQSQSNLMLAEIIVGPILLVVVFGGAYLIGRRAASPIELARRRQTEFTANASHELRTPLSVIEAQTELALRQDREPAWYRNAFGRVDVESKRMRRLIEDLLWLARYDTTGSRPDAEHVDMGVLAQTAVDRFHSVAESRRLRLSALVEGQSTAVTAPPEWLDHLLGVLIDNACRYTPEGGTVQVRVSGQGGLVRLAVDDSGPGIPVEERSRIFERFHRATDRPGGAGLGLAIADAIVKGTDGRWEVGTSVQGGASMAVLWPVGIPGERSPEAPPVTDAPPPPPPRTAPPRAAPGGDASHGVQAAPDPSIG